MVRSMYLDHCAQIIAPTMRADLAIWRRGAMFAVCSIRQPVTNVPDQLAALFDGAEEDNPLFGHKFQAFEDIMGPVGADIWARTRAVPRYTKAGCTFAISELIRIRGLGIVKAAFVAQLMGFDVACLDARNVSREKRNPRAYRTDGKTPEQLAPKVRAYVAETHGKARFYWDAWCADVATEYDKTPQEISELHLAIVPDQYVPF